MMHEYLMGGREFHVYGLERGHDADALPHAFDLSAPAVPR